MAVVESIERPSGDTAPTDPHVPTVVDGIVSAFDLFGVQGLRHCPRCFRPLGQTRPDAVTQAWITLGTTMYAAMGRLVSEATDEQR